MMDVSIYYTITGMYAISMILVMVHFILKVNRYKKAMRDYDRAIEKFKEDIKKYELLGHLDIQVTRISSADIFNKIMSFDPNVDFDEKEYLITELERLNAKYHKDDTVEELRKLYELLR